MLAYWIVFLIALVSSFALTAVATVLGRRLRIVDVPSQLSIHVAPIPRAGGSAMVVAFGLAVAMGHLNQLLRPEDGVKLVGVSLGLLIITTAGLLDDVSRISPLQKLLAEFLAGAVAVGFGVKVEVLPFLGIPFALSLFYLVSSANAMNLLDGMNGLAAGAAAVVAVFLGGLALLQNSTLGLVLSIALLGAALGFLPHNFPRARVFMGDAGSLSLGFMLASIAILLSSQPYDLVGFLAALLIIGLPALDTSAALVRRFAGLGDLFSGDREHLYDLLARRLGSNTRGVLATWGWAGAFGMAGLGLVALPQLLAAGVATLVVFLSLVTAAQLGAFGQVLARGKADLRAASSRLIERYGHPLLVDTLLIVAAFYTALLLRFADDIPEASSEIMRYGQSITSQIIFIVIVYALTNSIFGLYNRVWRYASSQEVTSIFGAVSLGTTVLLIAYGLAGEARPIPVSVLLLSAVMLIGAFTVYRYRWRLVTGVLWRLHVIEDGTSQRVVIVGAGEAGQLLAWQMQHQSNRYRLVGFVDDDPHKIGLRIHGARVLGNCREIPELVSKNKVDLLVLALHRISGPAQREILSRCLESRAQVKSLPDTLDQLGASNGLPALKDVTIEDLVARAAVSIDEAACRRLVAGKTVLVTGAAGSIGSELCRQVARFGPSRLVALDNNESGLFELAQEDSPAQDRHRLEVVVGDVTHERKMVQVFEKYVPQIVFHCAAYKHVPLMESFPCEAVQVNIGGTLTLLRLAQTQRVERLVYISSDKAVHPTNAMGTTKSIGEWLVRGLPANGTLFTAVRFGNVLGSRGSVVPVFAKQIDQGGPVTVTHPEVARFFMSIQEAVSLIIEAATFTQGNDLFVLDAGQEIRIDDLARKMIRLRGLRPEQDVSVVYTGLRQGEKMRELLSCPICEEREPTPHPSVFRVRPCLTQTTANIFDEVESLLALSCQEDEGKSLAVLDRLVKSLPGSACPGAVMGALGAIQVHSSLSPSQKGLSSHSLKVVPEQGTAA